MFLNPRKSNHNNNVNKAHGKSKKANRKSNKLEKEAEKIQEDEEKQHPRDGEEGTKEELQMLEPGLWMYSKMPRDDSTIILKDKLVGTFMMRRSQTQPNIVAMSLKSDVNEVRHFKLEHHKDRWNIYGKDDKTFCTITQLISYYKRFSISSNQENLCLLHQFPSCEDEDEIGHSYVEPINDVVNETALQEARGAAQDRRESLLTVGRNSSTWSRDTSPHSPDQLVDMMEEIDRTSSG